MFKTTAIEVAAKYDAIESKKENIIEYSMHMFNVEIQ